MSTDFLRNYIDIIKEAEQPRVQLDEGIMDMLNPYIKKAANALMSKFDPQTMQGLKQAYDQSGGDKNKFMSAIGITQQDLAPLAKGGQPVQEAGFLGSGSSLKSKVLTGLFNALPLVGIVDLLMGGPIGSALQSAGGSILSYLFYIAAAVLMWGVGSYDFGDMDKPKGQLPSDTGM